MSPSPVVRWARASLAILARTVELRALALLALGLLACGGSTPATPPAQRTFAVAVTTRAWVDTTRGTPSSRGAPATSSRNLPTEIWYPTPGTATGEARDAPLDTTAKPYPLVLFVHGSDGNRRQSTFLTDGLAAAGYVVAAADFPLTASSTPGGASDLHADEQRADLSFLADQIAAAAAQPTDAKDPLAGGAVDARRYAVVGHSTGGTVALLASYAPDAHDARMAAAVALAPCACFFGDAFFTTRALPLLVVAGSDDGFVPPADNGVRAFTLASAPRLLATLVGGNHLYFTDYPIPDDALHPMPTTNEDDLAKALARYGGGSCAPIPPRGMDPPLDSDTQHALTLPLVAAWLDDVMRAHHEPLAALEAHPDGRLALRDR